MIDWSEIAKTSGPLGIAVAAFVTAYGRGWLATGRELQAAKDDCERERAERVRERAEFKLEIGFWRDVARSAGRLADHVVQALPPKDQT